jgi:nicotinamidase-related amidase
VARWAVLTNDLQYDLVNKNPERAQVVQAFLPRLVDFLEKMRSMDVTVVHVPLINLEDDPHAERYNGWMPATRGTPGARILDELVQPSDLIVEKNTSSGFVGTDLEQMLKSRGVDTVIICGMQTQICVQTTAADAFHRGFNVIVPSDGVVSTRAEDQQRAIDWLASYCAIILTLDELVEAIATDSVPEFTIVPIP